MNQYKLILSIGLLIAVFLFIVIYTTQNNAPRKVSSLQSITYQPSTQETEKTKN